MRRDWHALSSKAEETTYACTDACLQGRRPHLREVEQPGPLGRLDGEGGEAAKAARQRTAVAIAGEHPLPGAAGGRRSAAWRHVVHHSRAPARVGVRACTVMGLQWVIAWGKSDPAPSPTTARVCCCSLRSNRQCSCGSAPLGLQGSPLPQPSPTYKRLHTPSYLLPNATTTPPRPTPSAGGGRPEDEAEGEPLAHGE